MIDDRRQSRTAYSTFYFLINLNEQMDKTFLLKAASMTQMTSLNGESDYQILCKKTSQNF